MRTPLALLIIAGLLWSLMACAAPFSSHEVKAPEGELVVAGAKLIRSEDGKTLLLEGQVNNFSQREVPFVQLRARFYDSLGNLIRTGSGNPEPAKIGAGKGASFQIKIPYDPAIARYRVDVFIPRGSLQAK